MGEKSQKQRHKHKVIIEAEECKGCERCVNACPKSVLRMGKKFNFMGFPYAVYSGEGCIGCAACYYTCPEPGAVTIVRTTGEE